MTKTGEAAIKISGTLANCHYDVAYADGKLTITTRHPPAVLPAAVRPLPSRNHQQPRWQYHQDGRTKSDGTVVEPLRARTVPPPRLKRRKDGSSVTENKDASGSTATVKTRQERQHRGRSQDQ
ncbi:MAG: hypothetical protein ACLUEU_01315 [Oscillospiraceae bacterium]